MENLNSFGQFWFWDPWQFTFGLLVAAYVPRLPYYSAWYHAKIVANNGLTLGSILALLGSTFGIAMFFLLSVNFLVFVLTGVG